MLYDLIIVGGGPAGADTAEYAAKNGLKVALIEKNKLGGVCLNEGCVPTKTLLHTAHIVEKAKEAKKYAFSCENPAIDLDKLQQRKTKIIRKLSAGIKMALTNKGVEIFEGEAFIEKKDGELYQIKVGENIIKAPKLILATGSSAIVPPIEGLKDVEYWTAKEALENKEFIDELVIIGGGVIGIEFASFFNSLGTKVTIIEMMPKILGAMDKELSEELKKILEKKGIKIMLETKLTKVNSDSIEVEDKEQNKINIPYSKILLSIGRKANTVNIGLENINIEPNKRAAIDVNGYMQSINDPNLYAIGDVNGVSMLAHTATREGVVAINHIINKSVCEMSYRAIPGIVYGDPEIASVGATEEDLINAGISYKVHKAPMTLSGRFVIENEMFNGLCKILTDEANHILGVHILGNTSSEILSPAIIAVDKSFTLEELSNFVFPHPTISEILRAVAMH